MCLCGGTPPSPPKLGTSEKSINVYPSPASAFISIEGAAFGLGTSVELFDKAGRLMLQESIDDSGKAKVHKAKVHTADLQNGVYYLHIVSEGRRLHSQKVVIIH
jgi:hypothetical protein